MSELTPQARAFLRAHRDDGEPTAEDAQRVRAALEVSLAGAAGLGAAAWVTRLTLVKWGLVVTLGLGGAALLVRMNAGGEPRPAAVANVPVSQQLPPPAESPEVVAEALAPPEPIPTTPAPPVAKMERKKPAAAPSAASEPPPPVSPPEATSEPVAEPPLPKSPVAAIAPPSVPEDELILLSRAQELLGQGRPQDALEVLTLWETHFSSTGQFAEEALAARAIALCISGNLAQGKGAAMLYFEKFPASPQRNRIERACP